MKKLFLRLRPLERRLVIGGITVLFALVNVSMVWPHFSDWGEAQARLDKANTTLDKFQAAISQKGDIQTKIKTLEQEGGSVSTDDQQNEFIRTVQSQSIQNSVNISSTGQQKTRTNEFFLEQEQTFDMKSREEQLVNFLVALGGADSMIRVRDLSLRPDNPSTRYELTARIKFVASYLKKPKASPATAPKPGTTSPAKPVAATSIKKIEPPQAKSPATAALRTNIALSPPPAPTATNKPVNPKKP